jgi:hypothetical protein
MHSPANQRTVNNSVFDQNYARIDGGAIITEVDCTFNISNSVFTGNHGFEVSATLNDFVSIWKQGGAMFFEYRSSGSITDSIIRGNTAGNIISFPSRVLTTA